MIALQLSPPTTPGPAPTDVAAALAAAHGAWGQRPAITVLSPHGREEQGFASLAQWAAKGAHLLELDLLLEPGDRLAFDAPLSWSAAAVCLAAWWAGVVVTIGDPLDAEVAVAHSSRPAPDGPSEVLWLGDAIDGAPTADVEVAGEAWVRAVQSYPDQPPRPRAAPDAVALRDGGRSLDQQSALALAADLGEGTLAIDADRIEPFTGLVAVALRPLVTGRPTVVLRGVDRAAAGGEKVTSWR